MTEQDKQTKQDIKYIHRKQTEIQDQSAFHTWGLAVLKSFCM